MALNVQQKKRLSELQITYPNVAQSELVRLVEVENEKPFDSNKWYCFLSSVNRKNFEASWGRRS